MIRFFPPLLIGVIFCSFFCFESARSEEDRDATKSELTQEKNELETLQKRIEDKKNRIKKTQKEEKKVISELDRIEKELFQKRRDLTRYEETLKKEKKEIMNITSEIESLQLEIAREETHLADRIKALYRLSRMSLTKALLSANSFPALVKRYEYMSRVIRYNLGVITDYSDKLLMIEQHKQKLEDNERKIAHLTETTRFTQKKFLRHQQEKTTLLAKVKSEKELHLKALEELKQASKQLQALIDKLEKGTIVETPPSTLLSGEKFSATKGKLAFPVEGRIITYFGEQEDPEFATVSFNKGIEIVAKLGSPIKAVLDGTVIYSDWFKGYGNIIIIDHGDGYYTLSGHASEFFKKIGDIVKAEEPIGLVGDSGSLKGPNLYFEIRHHGQPLDPLEWLRQK